MEPFLFSGCQLWLLLDVLLNRVFFCGPEINFSTFARNVSDRLDRAAVTRICFFSSIDTVLTVQHFPGR